MKKLEEKFTWPAFSVVSVLNFNHSNMYVVVSHFNMKFYSNMIWTIASHNCLPSVCLLFYAALRKSVTFSGSQNIWWQISPYTGEIRWLEIHEDNNECIKSFSNIKA